MKQPCSSIPGRLSWPCGQVRGVAGAQVVVEDGATVVVGRVAEVLVDGAADAVVVMLMQRQSGQPAPLIKSSRAASGLQLHTRGVGQSLA